LCVCLRWGCWGCWVLGCAGTAPRPHQKGIRPLQQLCPSAYSHTAGGSRCCLPGFVRPVMSRLAGAQRRHSLPAALLPCCPGPAAALVRLLAALGLLLPCLRPVPAPSPLSHPRAHAHSMTWAACSPDPTWPASAEFSPPGVGVDSYPGPMRTLSGLRRRLDSTKRTVQLGNPPPQPR
jgi:hypothetical protein